MTHKVSQGFKWMHSTTNPLRLKIEEHELGFNSYSWNLVGSSENLHTTIILIIVFSRKDL
jgi:hypothetical protein